MVSYHYYNRVQSPPLETLITSGLGYCCMWAFFSVYSSTQTIADRLGVSTRAVRKAKERIRSGRYCCESRANCMKEKIVELNSRR